MWTLISQYIGKIVVCLCLIGKSVPKYKKRALLFENNLKTVLASAPSGTRTLDTLIKSQVLYQLS